MSAVGARQEVMGETRPGEDPRPVSAPGGAYGTWRPTPAHDPRRVSRKVRPAGICGRETGPGLWHWKVLGCSLAGGAVGRFAEEVGVTGVAGVFLDNVGQQPTQIHPAVGRLIELTVRQRLGE